MHDPQPQLVLVAEQLVAASFKDMADRLDAATDSLLAYLESLENRSSDYAPPGH
jgi:hypothetical protein